MKEAIVFAVVLFALFQAFSEPPPAPVVEPSPPVPVHYEPPEPALPAPPPIVEPDSAYHNAPQVEQVYADDTVTIRIFTNQGGEQ